RQLPSPLDRLDPKHIPPLERFEGQQPADLVAVLGEHRGRQASPVLSVAYSIDGKTVASGGSNGLVRLWDTDPKKALRQEHLLGATYAVYGVAFSPDKKMLAACTSGGTLTLWDLGEKGPRLRATFPAATSPLYAVAFDAAGRLLATGGHDTQVRLWDVSVSPPKELITLPGHLKEVTSVAFAPEGGVLASGSADGTVRLWKLAGKQSEAGAVLQGHTKPVRAVAFSPAKPRKPGDPRTLASGGDDGALRFWTVSGPASGKERLAVPVRPPRSKTDARPAVSCLAYSRDGKALASGDAEGVIRVWNPSSLPGNPPALRGHVGAVAAVAFSPDGATVASGGHDWTVRLWDVLRRSERVGTRGHLSANCTAAFTPDGATIITGSHDTHVRLWNVVGPEPKHRSLLKAEFLVQAMDVSLDGRTLAAGGQAHYVRLWNLAARQDPPALGRLTELPGPAYRLSFSADGTHLLTWCPRHLLLSDVKTHKELSRFEGPETGIRAAAFSPDGKLALYGTGTQLLDKRNNPVKDAKGNPVWRDLNFEALAVEDGQLVSRAKVKPDMPMHALAFTPDGKQALSADTRQAVQRWDLAGGTPKPAAPVRGTSGYAGMLVVSPDGRRLATTYLDGQVVLWDLAKGTKQRVITVPEQVGCLAFASDSRHLAVGLYTGVTYLLRLEPPPGRGEKQARQSPSTGRLRVDLICQGGGAATPWEGDEP
ncbi:MAG TPA: WD40 repeat domain-containing protein, partial [Gemmataceae bacterium]|nr:WD40 repeat domain-containing protein [Gemmataceae bacterium]